MNWFKRLFIGFYLEEIDIKIQKEVRILEGKSVHMDKVLQGQINDINSAIKGQFQSPDVESSESGKYPRKRGKGGKFV